MIIINRKYFISRMNILYDFKRIFYDFLENEIFEKKEELLLKDIFEKLCDFIKFFGDEAGIIFGEYTEEDFLKMRFKSTPHQEPKLQIIKLENIISEMIESFNDELEYSFFTDEIEEFDEYLLEILRDIKIGELFEIDKNE